MLFHALGALHQHNRPDRDDYITINWEVLDPTSYPRFEIPDNSYLHGTRYSYRSIMHDGVSM